MIAVCLQLAALAALIPATIRPFRRWFLLISILCTTAALGQGLTSQGVGIFAFPWAVAAAASFFPLGIGLARKDNTGIAGGMATAMLWPACSAFIWQLGDAGSVTPGAWATGLVLSLVLGSTSVALCSALHNQQNAPQRNNRQMLVLFTLILIFLLPWGGGFGEVPLAMSSDGGRLNPAASLQILWASPPHEMPIEATVIASANSVFLASLRHIALGLAALSLLLLIWATILQSIPLRQLVSISVTTTALVSLLIPLSGFAVAAFTVTPPEQLLTVAIQRLSESAYFQRLAYAPEGLELHLLGLPVAAALLPALGVALLKSLATPDEDPLPTAPTAGVNPLLLALGCQFIAIAYILTTPLLGSPTMLMTESPWPTILAATLVTSASAMVARFGTLQSRWVSTGLWAAFTLLMLGLIGPGEGWIIS